MQRLQGERGGGKPLRENGRRDPHTGPDFVTFCGWLVVCDFFFRVATPFWAICDRYVMVFSNNGSRFSLSCRVADVLGA